jgi:predicted phage terminase large subunit-like protein
MQAIATTQPTQADNLLYAIEAEECRRSLKLFTRAVWPIVEPGTPFVDGWCLDAIIEHLEAISYEQLRFLLINIPPRHTKSTIGSVIWPVWDWIRSPEARFLCASYSMDLSTRDNRRKRNLIEHPWFQERFGNVFQLAGDQNVKRFFENDHKGYHLAVSVGSSATGSGGSRLVIDDPHSAGDAHSDAERESALTWFRETWSSRLNDQEKDAMVVIGQRIHERDVSGYIIEERPDWTHLNLPSQYERAGHCTTAIGWSDPRTEDGELLWPQRFTADTLNKLQRQLGPIGYSAQYQQSPVPASGGTFQQRHERLFTETRSDYILFTPKGERAIPKRDCTLFLSVDPAISEKQEADFMVIQTWAQTPLKDLLLLDSRRGHWSHHDQQDEVQEVFQSRNNEFAAVETVAYQNALFQDLINKGIPCKPFKPHTDKVARAAAAAIWHSNGKIYFYEGAEWLPDLQKELYKFPKASHDDQVDALSLASIVVRSRGPLSDDTATYEDDVPDPIEGPPEPEQEEEVIPVKAPSILEIVEDLQKDPFAYAGNVWGEEEE